MFKCGKCVCLLVVFCYKGFGVEKDQEHGASGETVFHSALLFRI